MGCDHDTGWRSRSPPYQEEQQGSKQPNPYGSAGKMGGITRMVFGSHS